MERIQFIEGTPVICVGLKNATHLNGKIGDIRKIHNKVQRPETAPTDEWASSSGSPEKVKINAMKFILKTGL